MQVCQIRRKYPYFGKEKIKRILERDCHINISVSSVGRILTQYRSILPKVKVQTKRIRTLKKKRTRLAQVKKDMKGIISEWLQIDTIELNLRFTKIFLVIFGRSLIQTLLCEGLSEGNQFKCARFSLQADLLTR